MNGASEEVALAAVLRRVEAYYSRKVTQYGPSPAGVDWASHAEQELRFDQLLKVCDFSDPFSLNDLGCGYGALLAHLGRHHPGTAVDYLGIDVSAAMIWHAQRCLGCSESQRFVVGHRIPRVADYTVVSGIFNVRLSEPTDAWRRLIRSILPQISTHSRKGFAINFMCRSVRRPRTSQGLYLTRPENWTDYCEHTFGVSVQVLCGYGLPEFTLLARHHPQPE